MSALKRTTASTARGTNKTWLLAKPRLSNARRRRRALTLSGGEQDVCPVLHLVRIPASLMTLPQRACSAATQAPNFCGVVAKRLSGTPCSRRRLRIPASSSAKLSVLFTRATASGGAPAGISPTSVRVKTRHALLAHGGHGWELLQGRRAGRCDHDVPGSYEPRTCAASDA